MPKSRIKQPRTWAAPISKELVLRITGLTETKLFSLRVAVNDKGLIARLDTGADLMVRPSGARAYQYVLVADDADAIHETKKELESNGEVCVIG